MARDDYLIGMRQRMADLDFQIRQARNKLADSSLSDRRRVELAGEIAQIESRRTAIQERLNHLEGQPEGTWKRLRAEVETERDALIHDLEERIGRLI